MDKQQKILCFTLLALGGLAVFMMVLSKIEPVLLMIGLACLTLFFAELTVLCVKIGRQKARQERNQKIEELMNSENEDGFDFEKQEKKRFDYDRYSYVVICLVAIAVTLYMFIRSVLSF